MTTLEFWLQKKMIYHLKTTNRIPLETRIRRTLFVIFFILVVFFGSFLQRVFAPFFTVVTAPFFAFGVNAREFVISILPYFKSRSEIIAENESLKNIAENYARLLERHNSLEREFARIKGSKVRNELENAVFAYVIRAPDATPYDTFLLSSGLNDGVKIGEKVLLLNSIPIGTIANVYTNTSVAKLYGSPGESYLAIIGNGDLRGTAYGKGGGNFEIILPHGSPVKNGDEIKIPEISEHTFSKVEDVAETEGGTFVRVLFRAPYSILNTSIVAVSSS